MIVKNMALEAIKLISISMLAYNMGQVEYLSKDFIFSLMVLSIGIGVCIYTEAFVRKKE